MLHPRPNRECRDRDPPPDRPDAPVCPDEGTSRRARAEAVSGGRRPARPAERPARHPAPAGRVREPHPGRTAAGAR